MSAYLLLESGRDCSLLMVGGIWWKLPESEGLAGIFGKGHKLLQVDFNCYEVTLL